MGGFTSDDDFINQTTVLGKRSRTQWNKNTFGTTAHTAGAWHLLSQTGGNPGASSILGTGTNLAFQALNDTLATAAGIQHGGNVGGGSPWKHLTYMSACSAAATTMPAVFMLVDLLGFYPITTVTTTGAQTLDNTVTLPRETTGAGVEAFLVPSTVMGAGTPTVALGYTNSGGTAGRATPSSPALPTINATAPVSQIAYSGTGAGKYGPFIPRQGADAGIRSVQSVNFNATMTSGVMNLVLAKPIFELPMTTLGVMAERDLRNQIASLPRIPDGACLAWLMYAGAATPVNSAFFGALEFAWS